MKTIFRTRQASSFRVTYPAFTLLCAASVTWSIKTWVDASTIPAAVDGLKSTHAPADMTDVTAAGWSAPSAFEGAAQFWSYPHELILTTREALEDNGIAVSASAPSFPGVGLPTVAAYLNPDDSISATKYADANSSALPKVYRLVLWPLKLPEELLSEGRCREGNVYIMGRPLLRSTGDTLDFDVNSAFLPEGKELQLTLPLNSIFVKEGSFETKRESLLICKEKGAEPVLISIQSFTSSLLPRFSPKPFSMPFKPVRVGMFQSPSHDVPILHAMGTVEAVSSDGLETWQPTSQPLVAYVARLEGPMKPQAQNLLYSLNQNPACSIERRELGGPVLLLCQDGSRSLKTTTLHRKQSRLMGRYSLREHPSTGSRRTTASKQRQILWLQLGLTTALAFVSARAGQALNNVATVKRILKGNYEDGLEHPQNRLLLLDVKAPHLSATIDSAHPVNIYRSARLLDDKMYFKGQEVDELPTHYYRAVLRGGLSLWALAAGIFYLLWTHAAKLRKAETRRMSKIRFRPKDTKLAKVVENTATSPVLMSVDTAVIYVLLP